MNVFRASLCIRLLVVWLLLLPESASFDERMNIHDTGLLHLPNSIAYAYNGADGERCPNERNDQHMLHRGNVMRHRNFRLKLNGGGVGNEDASQVMNRNVQNAKRVLPKNPSHFFQSTQLDDDEEEQEGHWKPMCRICYEFDPVGLFVPCKCTGSMGFVHR